MNGLDHMDRAGISKEPFWRADRMTCLWLRDFAGLSSYFGLHSEPYSVSRSLYV